MEEFIYLGGEPMPLFIAASLIDVSIEELRKSKDYFIIDLEDPYSE